MNTVWMIERIINMAFQSRTHSFETETDELVNVFEEAIHEIDRKIASDSSIDELVELITPLHMHSKMNLPELSPGCEIFRAVRIPTRPETRSRVSYPPVRFCSVNGRANQAGEVMFYGSLGGFGACLWECNAEIGEYFALGRWTVTKPILLMHFGYEASCVRDTESRRFVEPSFVEEMKSRRDNVLHSWEGRLFTEKIRKGEVRSYSGSIALTKVAMRCVFKLENEQRATQGVLYPSVAAGYLGDNVALPPDVVDSSLDLIEVEYVNLSSLVRLDSISAQNKDMGRYDILSASYWRGTDDRLLWSQQGTAFTVKPWSGGWPTNEPADESGWRVTHIQLS